MKRFVAVMAAGLAFSQMVLAAPGVGWVEWHGRLPRNAIEGGVDDYGRKTLFICRAHYVNGVHPGKLLNGHCHIGWGGQEVILSRFEVLVWFDDRHRRRGEYDDYRRR